MSIYVDFGFDMEENDLKEITIKTDLEAIKQSIKHIILTRKGSYTKYQDPDFGCGVLSLLGEKISSATKILIADEIEMALGNYEPRVDVIEVTVEESTDVNELFLLIKYEVLSISFVDELEISLDVLK